MPDLTKQPIQGGPTQPVYIMNGLAGDPDPSSITGIPLTSSATSGTKATAGNNTILAAPGAGKRIVVHTVWVQNESATDTTVQLIDVVARFRALLNQYKTVLFTNWALNENTALTMNLSGANEISYRVQY